MGLLGKLREGLRKTQQKVATQIGLVFSGFSKVDEELFEALEEQLILADVGAKTAGKICQELRIQSKKQGIKEPGKIQELLKETMRELLAGDMALNLENKPAVVLVIGVNGVGKTTTIGKLAAHLSGAGNKVILAAADTFRAAAIDQLQVWADRANVEVIRQQEGSDPAAVLFDTISAAKARGEDVIICDTAGRLHNKRHLMGELSKIRRVIDRELPNSSVECLLVLDAITGQNAVNQAREFSESAGITGLVLTKLDGTAKGGIIFALKDELGLPVKFVGVGEGLDDLQAFDAAVFVDALFDESE